MSKEAMTLALDLATMHHTDEGYDELRSKVRVAAKEALAKQEQPTVRTGNCLRVGVCASEGHKIQAKQEQGEPVAWMTETGSVWKTREKNTDIPLYTTPQPAQKPLTDEQIATISVECATVSPSDIYFARAIEAAHGIKENT